MNLLYIWNENYMIKQEYQHRGFLLNSKYDIEYDCKEKKLLVRKSKDFIENFWGNNVFDAMAIVGENGAGKTMLLNYIMDLIADLESVNLISYDFIIAFEHDDAIKIYTTENMIDASDGVISVDVDTDIIYVKNESADRDILMTYRMGYFTNALSLTDYRRKRYGYISDVSLGNMIQKRFANDYEMHYIKLSDDKIINYFGYEFLNVIKFVFSYEGQRGNSIIHWPDFIRISVNDFRTNEEYILSELKKMRFESARIQDNVNKKTFRVSNYFKVIRSSQEDMLLQNFLINLMLNLFKEYCIPQTTGERDKIKNCEKYLVLLDEFTKNVESKESIYTIIIDLVNKLEINLANNEYHTDIFRKYTQFILWIKENRTYLYSKIDHKVGDILIPVSDENKSSVLQIVEMYEKTNFPFPYLYFELGLSTGEFNFIKLFSDIYSITDEGAIFNETSASHIPCDNVLLMFDEADLSLHPRWQQEYMALLIPFIENTFKNCKVHLLIATHSPIMLSDFPKNNVIYLEENCAETKREFNTFGCNIHNLFLDSFFLNENGTIGRLAENKINQIAEMIIGEKGGIAENEHEIGKIIDIIGDDLIKEKLIEMYNHYKCEEHSVKKQVIDVNSIRETIDMLKKQKVQLETMISELEEKLDD